MSGTTVSVGRGGKSSFPSLDPVSLARLMTGRLFARAAALIVLACTVIVVPSQPAAAHGPADATIRSGLSRSEAAADLCSAEEWRLDVGRCLGELREAADARLACLSAPTPETPDAGLGGWFAQRPESDRGSGVTGLYTIGGYAGYSYTTYDIGCAATLMHPDYRFENTIANAEFMVAVGIIATANALRERAWDPGLMWSWADPLVEQTTKSLYDRVFTVFGAITLAVVGVYLLWRARQAQLSAAVTTAGWAVTVMVVVTAVAAWPVQSARLADRTLTSTLGAIHQAIGPQPRSVPQAQCPFDNLEACMDHRAPALRASDTAVQTMLYRNWLRGLLGSADSETAQKYGLALLSAKTVSWVELSSHRNGGVAAARERGSAPAAALGHRVAVQHRRFRGRRRDLSASR